MDTGLQRFGISIDPELLARFDRQIARKGYTNRSEAIRDLIRDSLIADDWQQGEGAAVGTITLVYDHHLREMADKLTDLQHQYHEQIVSVMHVHLDAHVCLEAIVVRGGKRDIQRIADQLSSAKGVIHCKLVATTTGEGLCAGARKS